MSRVIRTLAEVTPDRLTALLAASAPHQAKPVASVNIRHTDAFNSTVVHLELRYRDDPVGPFDKLVLKMNQGGAGQEEVAFYQLAQQEGVDTSMLVPCVSAAFDPEDGASHLLLLDVSATHGPPVGRDALLGLEGVPTDAHLRGVVRTLAHFHAAWWEHPLLGRYPATQLTERYRNAAAFEAWWDRHRRDYEQFAQAHGEAVPGDVHAMYQGALENYRRLWQRYVEPRSRDLANLTVTHNDCYLLQFLCPHSGGAAPYLVDFQSACTDFAARDLVYLMATFWTREQRAQYERDALVQYHQALLARGVTGFELDQLFEDYRLMLIDMIFHPVWDTTYGADPAYWQPKLKCLTDAYRDWRCDELFV